jgi:hypothetical protein
MRRRTFLGNAALLPFTLKSTVLASEHGARELRADVVVIGGSTGGCAAAIAAARTGYRVILTEETDWIGGQLTAQAVPPDEHPWIEASGATRLYRQFRTAVREYYRQHYPLTAEARAVENLNPGNGLVSRLCHEPRVALAVLNELLAPYVSGRRVVLLLGHQPTGADVDGDRVRAVRVHDLNGGRDVVLRAAYFLDATELGDLLPLTKAEYAVGSESQKETGEPHASTEANPANQQAFTCCFAMDYLDGEDHTIDKPAEYDFWRKYVPKVKPDWPGSLLSWKTSDPITLKERRVSFDPTGLASGGLNLWLYRRIAGLTPAMQTEAPRPDGKVGWKGLRLREDVVGTTDGLAKYPYIRESRRIKAKFTVLEQHVGTEARMQVTGQKRDEVTAERFLDTVGVGSYRIDLHPSSGGDNYIDVSSLPFQIPLRALIPRRLENLLPACKNLGVTHITNGCYRLHPVEWNIGEAAGTLAAFCLTCKEPPRQVRMNKILLTDFQTILRRDRFELGWAKSR